MIGELVFNWIRGDDEFETLIVTSDDGSPIIFDGDRFDLHIIPKGEGEIIRLSSETGEIVVNQNEIALHIAHDMTKNAEWTTAKWDLQHTSDKGIVHTLCGGKIRLKADVTKV